MTTVENLYKNFGVLADAKDKAGEVVYAWCSNPLLHLCKGVVYCRPNPRFDK